MISLFLDTCSAKLIVGVYNGIDPIVLNIEENDNHLSERILPLIDNTLKQANKKISDINNIIVVNGPGSFTGIRIGVTVAKMLAWCGNIKISTVSELEVLASDPNQYTASLIDARRGYVYAGLYDKDGKNIIKDQHIKLTDFMIMLKKYKLRSYNFILVFILIVTSVFALAVVNSANSAYTMKQGAGMVVSFIIMFIVSFIDYNWILKYFWIWYGVVTVMLIGVLTVFGHGSHGATRWFKIGPIQLQPSEFLKLALILLVAKLVAANKERLNSIKFLALIACLTLFPILLVAMQPNLSTTILLCLIIIAMLYCAGVSYKIFGIAILIAVPVISAFLIYVVSVEHPILIEDYQRKRIVDFIEGNKSEEVDMTDAGTYQQAYAVQAIGSGQLYGKGLNNNDTSSLKNAGYIAEAQNDFIFAVIGEELGFTGSCITIFLLFLIVLECIIVAVRARNFEGRLICCGVAIYIGFQTFINIGVVSWILPNTGVPLPFFSCGITSLLTLFIAMGIVLNVSLQRNVERDDDMFADDFRG